MEAASWRGLESRTEFVKVSFRLLRVSDFGPPASPVGRKTTDKALSRWHRLDPRRNLWGSRRLQRTTVHRIGRNDQGRGAQRPTGLSAEANRAACLAEDG